MQHHRTWTAAAAVEIALAVPSRAGATGTQTQTLLGLNNPDLVVDGVPLFGVSLNVELETDA